MKISIPIWGVYGSGKTTILFYIRYGKELLTSQSIGFSNEQFYFLNHHVDLWDIGGGIKIRELWKIYVKVPRGVIFVISSPTFDQDLPFISEEIERLSNEKTLKNVPLLIYLNKMDCPNSKTLEYVESKLKELNISNWKYFIQPSIAMEGIGLYKGLTWILENLQDK